MVIPISGGAPIRGIAPRILAEDRIPSDFPSSQLVIPKKVIFKSPDGVVVHAQLFEPIDKVATVDNVAVGSSDAPRLVGALADLGVRRPGAALAGRGLARPSFATSQPAPQAKRPAIVFVHGGPPRQMLLGWHYSDYYSNAYAMNQYLASRGFIVLSVNYRLGIGYGHDFHRPKNAGAQGASEYLDVKAAGEYLRTLPQVDPKRIGIYGGSYGGYLTALALARDSQLFAAGVDIHGVHNWTAERAQFLLENRYEKPADTAAALDAAWKSSPISSIATWKSPVLLIHGDDDRNVRFNQTTDLVRRLEKAGIPFDELVIPDDTHHFMRHANALKVNAAVAAFFERVLGIPNQNRER
jgi:dipeptidyl aminopeptidase/acylaminoacyl peptidase